jgi:hypothetical protein
MTAQLWIGFGFLALLVLFLIGSFFFTPKLTEDQRGTLKFLSALCAGFSGGFLTGSALFELHKTTGAYDIGISGTAGCALFFVVWFFYPRVFRLVDGFEFSIPADWTFRDTVDAMVQANRGVSDFHGFTSQELSAPIRSRSITSRSLVDAIMQLRLITVAANCIRPYEVRRDGETFSLTIRSGGAA